MKSDNLIDDEHTYDCNVVIRIRKEALIEIDRKSHAIPLVNNDMNIRLRLTSARNDLDLAEPTADRTCYTRSRTHTRTRTCRSNSKDSPTSMAVQFYKPASAKTIKTVDTAWLQCKKNKQSVKVRDLVMAKLTGHPAWPAIILEFLPNNKAKVEFLGVESHERYGFVSLIQIVLFKTH